MAAKKELVVTCEEGQALLRIASMFALPEKLGDTAYTVIDRALASDEVMRLYRELRSYSPMLQRTERWLLFGASSNHKEILGEGGKVGHKMIDATLTTKISLDEDAESGMIWLIVMCLHPASPICQSVSIQSDVIWPLAEKMKRVKAIKEVIGLDRAKARRWASDEVGADMVAK